MQKGRALLATCSPGTRGGPAASSVLETSYDFGTLASGGDGGSSLPRPQHGRAAAQDEGIEFSHSGHDVGAKPVVAPGATGEILSSGTPRIQGRGRSGGRRPYERPRDPKTILRLTGQVRSPIDLLSSVRFFLTRSKMKTPRRLSVSSTTRRRPRSHAERARSRVSRPRFIRRAWKSLRSSRAAAPGRLPAGNDRKSHPRDEQREARVLSIPVHLSIMADLYSSPDRVDFGEVSLDRVAREPGLIALLTQTVCSRSARVLPDPVGHTRRRDVCDRRSPQGPSGTFRLDVGLAPARLKPGPFSGDPDSNRRPASFGDRAPRHGNGPLRKALSF